MTDPGAGILLIADPFLKDPNFTRTVIFLCDHKEEGSLGFILNKKFDYTLDELLVSFEGYPFPVYYGGPVQIDTVHFIHQYPDLIPGGQEVLKNIYWGGDFEILTELIKTKAIDPAKVKFFIGYSGWDKGQLNNEISEKNWLTVPATRKLIFQKNTEDIWKDSLKHLGGEFKMLINFPIDPQLN